MEHSITLDQAASLDIADTPPSALVVDGDDLPSIRENQSPLYEPENPLEEFEPQGGDVDERRLSLDEAAAIDWDDGGGEVAHPEKAPAIVINGHALDADEVMAGLLRGHVLSESAGTLIAQSDEIHLASQALVSTAWELAGLLMQVLPPPPDPNLVRTNWKEYQARKTHHDLVWTEATRILNRVNTLKDLTDDVANQRHEDYLGGELAMLQRALPETKTPEGKAALFERIWPVAEECGFLFSELEGCADHRLIRLAELAVVGHRARKARKEKTKEKQRQQQKPRPARNRELTLAEAMEVDFD